MYEIKRIDVTTFAKIKAALIGAFGFLFGVVWIFLAFLAGIVRSAWGTTLYEGTGLGYSIGAGLLILIFGTVLGAVAGFILGAIIAALYNVIAARIGGMKVELTQETVKKVTRNP